MCIAAPGKIIDISNSIATIEYPQQVRGKAMIVDVVPHIDDYVMVQMGIVIKILPKNQAQKAKKAWESLP